MPTHAETLAKYTGFLTAGTTRPVEHNHFDTYNGAYESRESAPALICTAPSTGAIFAHIRTSNGCTINPIIVCASSPIRAVTITRPRAHHASLKYASSSSSCKPLSSAYAPTPAQ